MDYYTLRCRGNYQMLEKLNVIGRTSEFARLYGIEFENVWTRGSQVEEKFSNQNFHYYFSQKLVNVTLSLSLSLSVSLSLTLSLSLSVSLSLTLSLSLSIVWSQCY